jgi:acyl-CoA reductase-like NAD-dependent aldehyde dehydrogenase
MLDRRRRVADRSERVSQQDLASRLQTLRRAGEALRRRPAQATLDSLAAVFDDWRGPDSPWRRTLAAELPRATGFSAPVVVEGLRRGLESWSGESFLDLVASELPRRDRSDGSAQVIASGFGLTSVFLAGAIPMPSLLALLAPLALRSPVMAKTASRDPLTPSVVAESVAAHDELLGSCIDVVSFSGSDLEHTDALLAADCVVATGSDATVSAIGARVHPPRRLVSYGHRLSVAALGPAALRGDSLRDSAARLALDVALWDQLGCLSPIAAYVLGGDGADEFAEALAGALAEIETSLPRGELDKASAARIAHERSDAEMRSAAGARVAVHADDGMRFTVVREDTPGVRSAPGHRFIRVLPVRDAPALLDALHPLGPHLAAVGLAGFGSDPVDLARGLAQLGASRICPLGAMQAPPLDWRHDNRPVLEPLARFSDIEPLD